MKIIDCFMYFDEDMILDIRLNVLDKYVSYFVICEANFNHNGTKKELRFDINNFSKFKDKIIYLPLTKQPNNLKIINDIDTEDIKNSKILDNALIRENFQRNFLQTAINKFHNDDLIIISDLDEIPNLSEFKYKSKITFFKQKMFYYKLNLLYSNFIWVGSKICKKRHLINPQWIRNIKNKKYPLWRLDILFSKKKYNNIGYVGNGGWHFTNIKKAEDIDFKLKNFLHHLEYEKSGLEVKDLRKIINEKRVMYDHSLDQKKNKWGPGAKLVKMEDQFLPNYITYNKNKFSEWLD